MWDYQDIQKIKRLIDIGRNNEALQSIILFLQNQALTLRERLEGEILHLEILFRSGYLTDVETKLPLLESQVKQNGFQDLQITLGILKVQVYQLKGEFEQAKSTLEEISSLVTTLDSSGTEGNQSRKIWIVFLEGIQAWYFGNLDVGLQNLEEALDMQKSSSSSSSSKYVQMLVNYGQMLCEKGNFSQGLKVLQKALEIERQIGNSVRIAEILSNMGRLHHLRGYLDDALDSLQESLAIWDEIGDFTHIRFNLFNVGVIYRQKGDYHQALNYIQRSITIAETIGNPDELSSFILEMLRVYLEMNALENAQICLAKLYHYNLLVETKKMDLRYRIAKALLLKRKGRAKDIFMAQDIFEQITLEPVIDQEITQIAFLNSCELALNELQLHNNPQVFQKLETIVNKLLKFAENQRSFLLYSEVYLVKAKIALITLDIDEARKNLNQAQFFAEDCGLLRVAIKISEEHDRLLAQQQIWQSFQEKNANFQKRAEIAELDGIMQKIVKQKGVGSLKVQEEIPVALIIINRGGKIQYFNLFSTFWQFDKELLAGFLAAFDSMSDELFSQNLDRAKFGEFNVLVKKHSAFLLGYVYQGPSFYAQHKILQIYQKIISKDDFLDVLIKTNAPDSRTLDSLPFLDQLNDWCHQIILNPK